VQSAAAEIIEKLEELDLEPLVTSATETLDGAKKLLNAAELQHTIEALPDTVANVNETLDDFGRLALGLERKQGPLLDSIRGTSNRASATLKTLDALIDPDSPLASQLSAALQEVAGAARAVRLLADYLERNPSALVRGKELRNR
jgi:paraquat-inducible protein B